MLDDVGARSTQPTHLLDIIGEVRKRWRMKLALRGALKVGVVAAVLLFLAAYGIEQARFSPASVWVARAVLLGALLASGYWFLLRPLGRRVTDDQVALYLEEHEPSLQATLLSAVEASRSGNPASVSLVQRVVQQAVEACARVGASRRADEAPLRGYTAALAVVAITVLAVVLVGPAFIRQALSAMFYVARVQAAVPYTIEVKPGNTSVPKGSDQTVVARLLGFEAEDATVMMRRAADGKFEPISLVRTDSGTYEAMLFDVNAQLDYYVEADGVRTPVFTMKVVEVPYAQRIALEYRFPAYTGLEPQKIEDGGDVAVLKGTEIVVQVFPTMKTTAGRLALGDDRFVALTPQADGSLTAAFKADRDGFYHVELEAPNGERVTASPQYTIDVLEDRAPTVSFVRPGRDTTASAVEEVFVEAKAEDDFGVRDLELVYSVNGGEEKVVKLFGGAKRLQEVSAGHTFYLEELGVQVGDSVSYFARALDNDGAGGVKRATSDLYFLRVRPFSKDFRQAQSQGGGGGGGGGGGQVEALSEQQRQIISATFNVQRDRRTFTADKLRQSSVVVALSQSRLREQVEGLITRMNSQLVQQDPAFAKIAELMPQAVAAMKEAEGKLSASTPEAALPHEHKALQVLQKAEEEYELQVSAGQQGGGGGGGGGGAMQQELSEIFDQELDKMASRYETANQSMQQEGDREVDDLLEKLKELARRQEQEAERQRRRALEGGQQQGGGGGGGGGGAGSAQQRALAEQVEEAARRLERLAREEERQDLADAARQMREAADAMRKAAAGGDGNGNASAQAQAALERLRETERRLQRGQAQRAERDIQQAKAQADDLARRQQEIAEAAKQLAPAGASERAQQARQINEKKDALDAKMGELEGQLDRAARDAAGEEKSASRKMAEAAGAIRDNRLRDKVRYSRQLVARSRNPQDVNAIETDIAGGIDELRQRLDEAEAALGQGSPDNKRDDALDRARRLARGAESLAERTRERSQQQGQPGQGQEQGGQQGQQARDQQSQQARNQQGQQGRQGQGQQGQQGQGKGQGQGQGEGQGQGQGQGQGEGQGQGQGDGQGGQQGGDGQGGGFANGGMDRGGAWNGGGAWGGWWDGRNARLTPEDARQLRNDARQYLNDARELRGQLRGQDIDPKELEGVMNALRELEDDRTYQNVSELVRLQTAVAEGLKRFEFALRRKIEGDANAAALSGSDDVPTEFRPLVEQYYRSLARTPR